MAQVRLEHVTKRFDSKAVVVKDVSININDKEFVVLVGPSGCGKSTTLRMIAGLEEISEGSIYIDECVVNDVPPKDRDIAMVFQNYALYPHMTVFENLAFSLKMRKYPKDDIRRRVSEAAEILGINEMLDRKPKALSGGQRQRVALGRAIVRRPKVFLFDEPLSNLDANLRVQMRTEISRLHRQLATTMIYVTHDQIEAMSMGDRIVVMEKGIVQQMDAPLTIYNSPVNRFVAGFIGSPTMNFFEGKFTDGGALAFEQSPGGFRLPVAKSRASRLASRVDQPVTVGIRPEHIAARSQGDAYQRVSARIEVTEPVGNEIFVYFMLDNSSEKFVSRIPADIQPEVGKSFDLFFDTTKLHFFDKTTGASI
ncbi:MAG TPA: sn-glycerol-3-phosphate ABC transporter ATP-binding protein UgpC [Bacteroidota bacterium]|jgi:multiple sugar transport system ATP-binding protein|nr:sn-glycerol-3-phosphate ABC transporter ATP-binding protein UgpC [Bacteroidota bacterium]